MHRTVETETPDLRAAEPVAVSATIILAVLTVMRARVVVLLAAAVVIVLV